MTRHCLVHLLVAAAIVAGSSGAVAQQSAPTTLRIVVIEGEDAVNVVQQKTAVAPVVEVRDRNDQPVAGAVVRFAIRSGRATFSGSRTLTLTTNAAGRAAVTGFTPTGSGALQISASVAFQGQTAAITIAQTNVMTLAEAAQAGAAGAGAGGAGGGGTGAGAAGAGGGAGGGGLSATTVAVVGGAAAGGAIAAKEIVGGGGGGTRYSASFAGPLGVVFGTCTRIDNFSGTVTIDVDIASDGGVSGDADITWSSTLTGQPGCGATPLPDPNQSGGCCPTPPKLNGTKDNMTFTGGHSGNAGTQWTYDFAGAVSNNQLTGTLTLTIRAPNGLGSSKYPLTPQ